MSETQEIVATDGLLRAVIDYDPEPSEFANPRVNASNLGVMWARHDRYILGDHPDANFMDSPDEWDDLNRFVDHMLEWHSGPEVVKAVVKHLKRQGATVVLPLYLLDHSGLSISCGWRNLIEDLTADDRKRAFVSDPGGWDTSYIGYIFDTPRSREVTGVPVELVEQGLREEVDEYDKMLTGDVWTVRIERNDTRTETIVDSEGNLVFEEEDTDYWTDIESIGGHLGRAYATESAKEMLAEMISD